MTITKWIFNGWGKGGEIVDGELVSTLSPSKILELLGSEACDRLEADSVSIDGRTIGWEGESLTVKINHMITDEYSFTISAD